MIFEVEKRRFRRDGKLRETRSYYLRYRFGKMPSDKWKSLGVSDKQAAQKVAQEFLAERQREEAGILEPKLRRDSASRPLAEHVQTYVDDLRAKKRAAKWVKIVGFRLTSLFDSCGWTRFADISADGFLKWRSANRERHGAKTLNDYLGTCASFITWAERCDRIKCNPLRHIERVEVRGHERVRRRALTEAELRRLVLAGGPERGLAYFFSGRTGLRRAEMKSVTMADIHLHEATPYVMVRASAAKNRKEQPLPLIPELLERLQAAFPEGTPRSQRLFPRLPKMPRFYRDLEAAGIPRRNSEGLIVDFHSLRHTWNTFLHRQGVPMRQAQALMRHSDPKLTGKVYLTESMLPLAQTVNALPPLFAAPGCAQIYAQILGAPGRKLSPAGGATEKSAPPQSLGISVFDGDGRAGTQTGGVGEMVRDAGFEPATPRV